MTQGDAGLGALRWWSPGELDGGAPRVVDDHFRAEAEHVRGESDQVELETAGKDMKRSTVLWSLSCQRFKDPRWSPDGSPQEKPHRHAPVGCSAGSRHHASIQDREGVPR